MNKQELIDNIFDIDAFEPKTGLLEALRKATNGSNKLIYSSMTLDHLKEMIFELSIDRIEPEKEFVIWTTRTKMEYFDKILKEKVNGFNT